MEPVRMRLESDFPGIIHQYENHLLQFSSVASNPIALSLVIKALRKPNYTIEPLSIAPKMVVAQLSHDKASTSVALARTCI
jgi:hypothetical protein